MTAGSRTSPAAAPAALVVGLLLLATWWQGAFGVRHWAPLTVFALVVLAVLAATGGLRLPLWPAGLAAVAIWALAGWALLSAVWADSPADAVEGGLLTVLYAALATIAVGTLSHPRQAIGIGLLAIGGVSAIAAATYVGLVIDGEAFFLAGRLDDPVGYRNATAALFALAFWPLVSAAATRRAGAATRALTLALAALVLGLAFLTQSRGMVLGLAAGALVALGLGPERLRRAWMALLLGAGLLAFQGRLLAPYDAFVDAGISTDTDIARAVSALGILTLASFLCGLLIALYDGGLRPSATLRARLRTVAAVALAGLGLVAAGGTAVAVGNPIGFLDERLTEFRSLDETPVEGTRLVTVGGQRYDLWRVAVEEARGSPVIGVGEGSYRFGYFQERRTDRNLTVPHSLPLRLLAELGLVGLLLFAVFLVAVAASFVKGWGAAPIQERLWASGLASAGVVVLAQSTVDWMWFVPGLMGLGIVLLCLAAFAIRPPPPPPRHARPHRVGRASVAGVLALLAVATSALYLSDVHVRQARAGETAADRLDAARTAQRLNPLAVEPRYLRASALEELGRVVAARRALERALELEPASFVTHGLLGDLETRAGNESAARSRYRRALELNPRDVGLRILAGEAAEDRGS